MRWACIGDGEHRQSLFQRMAFYRAGGKGPEIAEGIDAALRAFEEGAAGAAAHERFDILPGRGGV